MSARDARGLSAAKEPPGFCSESDAEEAATAGIHWQGSDGWKRGFANEIEESRDSESWSAPKEGS